MPTRPEVEPGAVQLGPVELGDVERVRHRRHLGLRPAGVFAAQPRVVLAHAHHLVHGADLELARVGRAQLEAVQPDQQPRAAALVPAVPDRVRPAPLADHHVGPGRELPARRRVVLAERGPLIQPDLQVRLQPQVAQQRREELQVVTGHHDAQPRREAILPCRAGRPARAGPRRGQPRPVCLPGPAGRNRRCEVPAQPLRGVVQGELLGGPAGPVGRQPVQAGVGSRRGRGGGTSARLTANSG